MTEFPQRRAGLLTALGLALTCNAALVLEIGLTRILSVTVWYHFSFVAVSLALLGMSAGSIAVYARRKSFIETRPPSHALAWCGALFGVTTALAISVYLAIDTTVGPAQELPWLRLFPTLIFVIPFFFSGMVVALALTAYASDVSRLYFWDLLGAGLGGLVLVGLLGIISGPSVILAMGFVGALGALLFALSDKARGPRLIASLAVLATATLLVSNLAWGWLFVRYTKSYDESDMPLIHEQWGPMARLSVFETHWARDGGAYGWGMSERYDGPVFDELWVEQDAAAGTPITRYDGDPQELVHLPFDVTSIAYRLLDEPKVAALGVGGGRDVLTALHFGARHVVGVEINADMVNLVRDRFADFAGRLYDPGHDPRVEIVVADGRSFLARTARHFDLIQISLIDSWAASAAGAFVLAENSLYTVEAFDTYWQRLSDDGILSVSRWCMSENPPELLRLVTLALETMRAHGVPTPERHLMVITHQNRVGTVMLKKSPFVTEEIRTIHETASELGFDLAYAPDWLASWDSFTGLIAARDDLDRYMAGRLLDLRPPTDDRPFFFLMLRPWHALDAVAPYELGLPYNAAAVRTLAGLFVAVTALVLLLILFPLRFLAGHGLADSPHRGRFLLYFGCLGLGFILIEIPLIQKLILFLGHPTYALTVVLSTLLVASGIGSYLTTGVTPARAARRAMMATALVVIIALGITLLAAPLFAATLGLTLVVRVVIGVAILVPLGLVMGMPFPLGVKVLENHSAHSIVPWVWGVNGATSVLATVAAFVLALGWGYTFALLCGVACYAAAFIVMAAWPR